MVLNWCLLHKHRFWRRERCGKLGVAEAEVSRLTMSFTVAGKVMTARRSYICSCTTAQRCTGHQSDTTSSALGL